MINHLIEEQLKRVEKADLTNFNPETNTYVIPKRKDIKLAVDSCYICQIKPTLINDVVLRNN